MKLDVDMERAVWAAAFAEEAGNQIRRIGFGIVGSSSAEVCAMHADKVVEMYRWTARDTGAKGTGGE